VKNTVFISSTYEDLLEHRKKVWETLDNYEVNVMGMERFGARKEHPLQTCLSEVEQCDIFVCFISFRLGVIDPLTSLSYTQLEYEKAFELGKEIFIYLIDEQNGNVVPKFVDFGENHAKLESFKSILLDRHTIDKFKDAADLAEKLSRKFDELLTKKVEHSNTLECDFTRSADILQKFLFLPKEFSSKEVKLRIELDGEPFPASKAICKSFSLNYGRTLGIKIKLKMPLINDDAFKYLFVESKQADDFLKIEKEMEFDIYASPNFTEDNIGNIRAHFVSKTSTVYYLKEPIYHLNAYSLNQNLLQSKTENIQAEGQIILLLKVIVMNNLDGTQLK
jgi:hypothetical protein